jgi:hypothetical protein
MKPGDLVTIKEKHRSIRQPEESLVGLIVERYPAEGHLDASVDVLWSGQSDINFAFPDWLEVISESG